MTCQISHSFSSLFAVELKDLQAILNSLPSEVQIEYKMKVEEALKEKTKKETKAKQGARKVQVKSAETVRGGRKAEMEEQKKKLTSESAKQIRNGPANTAKENEPQQRKKPLKINERPAWGSKATKKVVKMSEKDPFYQQKKEERELKKAKRERQLKYLQELNKERIPSKSKSPGRSPRDPSPDDVKVVGERGRKPVPKPRQTQASDTRDVSPNILSLVDDLERGGGRSRSPKITGRSSPPVPSVRHRAQDSDRDAYYYTNSYLKNSQTDTRLGLF